MATQAGPSSSTLAAAMEMPSLRQSSRTKRPSQRAEEILEESRDQERNPSLQAGKSVAGEGKGQGKERNIKTDTAAEVFCLCRKGDDGKPMVFCAECNDW